MAIREAAIKLRWSHVEDDALLRAWADVVHKRAHSLYKAFGTTCVAAGLPHDQRTPNSLQRRLGLHKGCFRIVCAFHASRQQQYSVPGGGGGDDHDALQDVSPVSNSDAAAEYSSDSWFELHEDEQRRWFVTHSSSTYKFYELSREMFDRIQAIYDRKANNSGGDAPVPSAPLRKESRAMGVEDLLSTMDLRATIAHLKGAQGACGDLHKKVLGGEGNRTNIDKDENCSSGGSSTESDDEFLTMWDEHGDVVPRSPVNGAVVIKLDPVVNQTNVASVVKQLFSNHQEGNKIDPDFVDLVGILETQTRHLGGLFQQTKRRRLDENRERRYIWKKIKTDFDDRNRVLEDIERREQELELKRDHWKEERWNIKGDLAQLRERKAVVALPSPAVSSAVVEQ